MNSNTTLTVASIPLSIETGKKDENLRKAIDIINKLPSKTDIAVLPELFSTAFVPDRKVCELLAEDSLGPTISALKAVADSRCMAIAGSFLAKDGVNLYNRAFFIEPNGDINFYDKRHTFSVGRESEVISKGDKPSPIIRFRSWNIAMAVCYDIRFPVWCRNRNIAYDLLIVPANWPAKRVRAWNCLLQARAIENQAYVIGANRSGEDEFGKYDDQTYFYDYLGKAIATKTVESYTACLTKDDLELFREAFPVWKDMDNFVIEY